MNELVCARLWQAEASVDGRLSAADAASFERHVQRCEACTKEMGALDSLTERMGALPDGRLSELERRRARNALLKAADERVVSPRRAARGRTSWKMSVVAIAAAACIAGGWVAVGHRAAGPQSPVATGMVQVRDEGAARWTEESSADATRVTLTEGKASFQPEPSNRARHFVVAVPDGRVEARGARFSVAITAGHTREVIVFEGSVSVSVAGYLGEIEAGGRWSAEDANRPNAGSPAPHERGEQGSSDSAVDAGGAEIGKDQRRAVSPLVQPTKAPSIASPDAGAELANPEAPQPSVGSRFGEAMAAFSAGDYGRADLLFAAFARDFPRDGRTEDATFLRAESRARRGDTAGATTAAREYLRAYPRGFRRPEAMRLAGDAEP